MTAEPARMSIDVPEPIKIELERLAIARNVSEADLVAEALARFVDEEADYLAAVDEALTDVEDGVFVSGESAVRWMRSWGTERELPTPEADILPSKAR